MKLNISVELDWIEENGSIDEEVKHQLINGVKQSISKQCLAKVEKEASKAIDEAIKKSIDSATASIEKRALDFADNWLENEVEITDKWGDVKEHTTVKGLVKRTFDGLLEKKVDSDGRFTDSYSAKMRLIDYLTGKRVEEEVSARLGSFSKDIDKQIAEEVEKGIKKNVSDKFAQMVIGIAKEEYKNNLALDSK